VKTLLLTFLFILSFTASAYSVNVKIEVTAGDSREWIEGETKSVRVTLWPISEVDQDFMIKTLKDKFFLDFFYVSSVSKAQVSPHNPEAFVIEMKMTLAKGFDNTKPLIWSYKALNIPFDFKSYKIDKNKTQPQGFSLLTEKKPDSINDLAKIITIILTIIILTILTLIYFKRKNIENIENDIDWKAKFFNASNREDFEELYKNRQKWMNAFGGEGPVFNQFCDLINRHQYKREWGPDELNEVQLLFEEIKESLQPNE
jgi:hypothetical protein